MFSIVQKKHLNSILVVLVKADSYKKIDGVVQMSRRYKRLLFCIKQGRDPCYRFIKYSFSRHFENLFPELQEIHRNDLVTCTNLHHEMIGKIPILP